MKIETFAIGPLETNSYLAHEGSLAVAIDVGGDPKPMLASLARNKLTLTHILLTHVHFDHTYGVGALHEATGAKVLAGAGSDELMRTELGRGGFMGLPPVRDYSYETIAEGEFEALGQVCKALATPGHAPGSLTFHFPAAGVAFVGDLVFYRSVGRSDFPGGSHDVLVDSVRRKVFTMPGSTVLYPGHGPETTVDDERLHNPYFSDFAR
ncbi:MBL fold metallo-hydrolase [Fundidesulfovibrio agrisoli]|uniref:MBL fold metallo-hydrolase n=1 Tax=Fundidesulfovibrio agrisoli TaxID=2922717 RepID=UPI001FACAEC2|nr:MBL fold metallo-hydrolase [Fundidesulfovibrio agrisoli]